ncbi:unnamed protein product [Bursaphelenchus xylophilus]|uniref:(pine wood nematode) hypothetical protein n=1 Tax=Bursaphelenchus xylophilus TaxID=6326 RepID=A0A1I7SEC4_BURXY|nr:unnamed protein product [Bursaphelenchus xylophilus]CAG9087479.1 unnamed protein product [Bursaphelenchus xylophilus]
MNLNTDVVSTTIILCFLVGLVESMLNVKKINGRKFPHDAFPEPTFDKNAPFCIAEREPCGFYSFGHNFGTTPFKWVKSWCKCSEEHECVFDRTDMRMRVFRQVCVSKEKAQEKENAEESIEEITSLRNESTPKDRRKHRRSTHRHVHHHRTD